MSKIGPLSYRDALKKAQSFGIREEMTSDSSRHWRRDKEFIPVRCRGDGTELYPAEIRAILRRFNIDRVAWLNA